MPNSQILQLPNLYTNDFKLAYSTSTALTMTFGQKRDATNVADMKSGTGVVSLTLNTANNGANGLDTGDLAASTWYYIYVIGDSKLVNPAAGLISTSPLLPTMPTGWDVYALQGAWRTDGSTHFLLGYWAGNGNYRRFTYDADISVLAAGTASTLTLIDLSGAVPPIENTPVILDVDFTPATANDKASFAVVGSTATLLPHVTGSVAAKVNSGQLTVLSKLSSSVAKVQYINSAASGSTTAWVNGYEMFV